MRSTYVLGLGVLAVFLADCSDNNNNSGSSSSTIPVPSSVEGAQGSAYSISVFAQTPGDLQPDDLLQVGNSVFVVCQDPNVNPDGTLASGVTSAQAEVIEYDLNGNVQQTFEVPGHPDGMTLVGTSALWISSNEDANTIITVVDISNNTLASYTYDQAPAQLPHRPRPSRIVGDSYSAHAHSNKTRFRWRQSFRIGLGNLPHQCRGHSTRSAAGRRNVAPFDADGNGRQPAASVTVTPRV